MAEFIVHSVPGSPYGRAVLATLETKGAAYAVHPVAPGTADKPPHVGRHPFAKVPVLQDGEFLLYECQAILRYLDRTLPDPPLTPKEPRRAARMDQLLNVNDWYLFQGCSSVICFHRIVGPRLFGLTPDEAAIAATMPKAHRVFQELARLLDNQTYFTGEEASLADLAIAPQLDFFSATPEWTSLTQGRPNLVRWLERMNERPALQATTWERVEKMACAPA